MIRTLRQILGIALIWPTSAAAGRVPSPVQEELARVHRAHGSPLLILAEDPDTTKRIGRWIQATDEPHMVRRVPVVGTRSYERQIALERSGLRCGVEVSAAWTTQTFGDCALWVDGPRSRPPSVPAAQPTTEHARRLERGAAVALGPIMSTGTIVDLSLEARLSSKGSMAFTYSSIQVRNWGSPALLAVQGRRWFWGDVDRGLYALAQAGLLSTDLGTVRSPGAAVGLGLKYTTRPGLLFDGYLGAGPGWPVPIHPAVGARVGWAF